ncbi:uncharacterized protein C20orf96-like isoform X2 [Physella acuta]|nr:uncharacterized protein C20orf96-like isoform X2 [Physella acuta]XP_059139552.1 uncharacterized protein C20orf96-like isoform X2 [Physella acuta]
MASAKGNQCASHTQKHLANDELLRTIEHDIDFLNYNQWQRKEKKIPQANSQKVFTVGTVKNTNVNHEGPSKQFPRTRRVQASLEEERQQQEARCDVLMSKIRHAQQTTDMYIKREKELIEINIQIAKEIESKEAETHAEVKRLLRKYEKFRGGINFLNTNFAKELTEGQMELDASKMNIKLKLEALEHQVDEMDKRLKSKQNHLSVLQSYKDKEYPVKAMIIVNLQAELEALKNSNQEDLQELEHIINTELGKYEKDSVRRCNEITRRVTNESIALMHPSLKDMALQNLVMKKEIEFHKKEQEELRATNQQLQEEVERLLKNPLSNLRLQLFPEFFPKTSKCTPDMDVVLDIPKQEWLPI